MAILSSSDQKAIDSVIQDIFLRTGLSYPQNDLVSIAQAENIRVTEADLSALGSNVSGLIDYEDPTIKSSPHIYINFNISQTRKQFTLAHELGHHFLHEGLKYRIDNLDYSKADKDTMEETQANYFAASLLVPKDEFIMKIKESLSVEELANYFGVSQPVIQNRIKWLRSN